MYSDNTCMVYIHLCKFQSKKRLKTILASLKCSAHKTKSFFIQTIWYSPYLSDTNMLTEILHNNIVIVVILWYVATYCSGRRSSRYTEYSSLLSWAVKCIIQQPSGGVQAIIEVQGGSFKVVVNLLHDQYSDFWIITHLLALGLIFIAWTTVVPRQYKSDMEGFTIH